jgi:ribosome-interacting GTPase 1
LNKIDAITIEELELLDRVPHYVPISANLEWNFDGLMTKIWEYLNIIRIYTKPKGLPPDYDEPVVIPRGKCTIEEFCNRIHKQIMRDFKYALVWGQSVKHYP